MVGTISEGATGMGPKRVAAEEPVTPPPPFWVPHGEVRPVVVTMSKERAAGRTRD